MKITIITACYNSAATIGDTINSVSRQTFQEFEHLIIDGKSTDLTIDVVDDHRHPNLMVFSEPDNGIYDAMNKGLRHASGEVIGFLNSDDYYADASVLDKIHLVFQDKSVMACYGDLVYVSHDKTSVSRYWRSKSFSRGDFSRGWCPPHPTFYVRKSALERLGVFDLSFKMASDIEFMMRYLESGSIKSAYIPNVLVCMRIGGVSNKSWGNILKQNNEVFIALQKNKIQYNCFSFWAHKIMSRAGQYFAARLFFP